MGNFQRVPMASSKACPLAKSSANAISEYGDLTFDMRGGVAGIRQSDVVRYGGRPCWSGTVRWDGGEALREGRSFEANNQFVQCDSSM